MENKNELQLHNNDNDKNVDNVEKLSLKSKNIFIYFSTFLLIVIIVLGISLGVHFGNKNHNHKPKPPTPNPKPVVIDVNKKFLTLNVDHSADFLIPYLINGKLNHFAADAFSNLPNNKYYLDFSKQNNVTMLKSNNKEEYDYSVVWDVKINKSQNGNNIIVDNYYGFNFKNENDYSISDVPKNITGINKYYYSNMKQNLYSDYFYIDSKKFVSWPKGFTEEHDIISVPLQKLDNLQVVSGDFTPSTNSKQTHYKYRINWYDPDGEVSVIFYSNSYNLVPNLGIQNNLNDVQLFKFEKYNVHLNPIVKTAKLNYPGEKEYDLDKKSPIYKTIDSKLINSQTPAIYDLWFYRRAIDENKKPLIFTLTITLANKKDPILYTFNISDVPENTRYMKIAWDLKAKKIILYAYDTTNERIKVITITNKK